MSTLKDAVLWPTPTCQESEHPFAELTENGRRKTGNGNSHSLNLADSVRMWPTPTAQKGLNGGAHSRELIARMIDSDEISSEEVTAMIGNYKNFWPTPLASEARIGYQRRAPGKKGSQQNLTTIVRDVTYPTPGVSGLANGSGNCEKANQLFEEGMITDEERKSFRAGNGGQLNPDWVEWLMGWPIGWTRLSSMNPDDYERWKSQAMNGSLWEHDPAELPGSVFIPRVTDEKEFRQQRLKALGNGQVPSAACLAEMLLV